MTRASIVQFLSSRKFLLVLPVLLAPGAMPYIPVAFEGTYRGERVVLGCGLDSRTNLFMDARDGRIVSYRIDKAGNGLVELQYLYRTGTDGVVTLYTPASRPGDSDYPAMKAYPRLTGTRFVSLLAHIPENEKVYRCHKFTPEGTTLKAIRTLEIVSQETYHPDSTATREIYGPDFRLLRTEVRGEDQKWRQLTAAADPGKR